MLHSLYRIADLTVVPSIYEPFGLVALEAMASGCPCLVADTGGLREVVPNEDVGLRFRSRDPDSLSTMAERLLTDTELRDRLVAEASEHVLSFDWADVARQVGAVYRELVEAAEPAQRVAQHDRGDPHRLGEVDAEEGRRHRQQEDRGQPERRPVTAGSVSSRRSSCTKPRRRTWTRHRPFTSAARPRSRRAPPPRPASTLDVVQLGGERHQDDQPEEEQVEGHQRPVEAVHLLEQVVVDDPEAPDQREGERVGAEAGEDVVDQRVAQALAGPEGGTSMFSTSSGIATAITPSVKAAIRPTSRSIAPGG